jgi:error-prone DNA polymerase
MTEARLKEVGLDPADPLLARTLEFADEIAGFPRHLSQHVGGFVLTKSRLDETVPIGNAAMEARTVIEWDKDDIDALGILKVDVLGLGMLSCIRKAFELIENWYGVTYSLASVPREDPAVYDMLCRADSVGVFQVESRAQMNMLPRLKPRCFYDLVIEVAIVRPGPIQGDMVHPYLRRRQGLEAEDYPAPDPAFRAARRTALGARQDKRRAAVPGAGDAARHGGGGVLARRAQRAQKGHGDVPPPRHHRRARGEDGGAHGRARL